MASDFGIATSIGFSRHKRLLVRRSVNIEGWLEAERDQLALWLPVALLAGIAAWLLLPGKAAWIICLLATTGVAGLSFALGPARRLGHAIGWFAIAMAAGTALIWWRAERVAAPRLERPVVAHIEARVEAVEPIPARGLIRLRLVPTNATLPPLIRVNHAADTVPAGIVPGATVALRARLMPPAPPAVPGAYDFARVAWFQGIGATGRAIGDMRVVPARDQGLWQRIGVLRARLSAHIQSRLDGARGGIAAALATGDQGAIPEEDVEAMRRSGLAHLLSISGLHVTAVVGGAMLLALRVLALSPALALRWPLPLLAAGAGATAGIAYMLLAGAEVPTVRSCIAALLVLGGIALGREAITLRLVAAGALVVLLLWPEAAAGPSFQLSFAAIVAIVALHEHPRIRALLGVREEGAGRRMLRAAIGLLLTGLLVEAALAPVALYHFHRAGLYGAAANIVAIPPTTFVIMPLEALALLLDPLGMGAPAWWLAGKALGLLLFVAQAVSSTPGATKALPAMPDGAFALMAVGGLWLALWRTRVRRIGVLPLAIGALWAVLTPAPDLLVTGDGRHLAIRQPDGTLALLRPRAGDYVRDMLAETAGVDGDAMALDDVKDARCGPDLCVARIDRDGRRWTLLATRSRDFVEWRAMIAACAHADIVVSDRRLPAACAPRWMKADRAMLARTGGLAINLASGRVQAAGESAAGHPWAY